MLGMTSKLPNAITIIMSLTCIRITWGKLGGTITETLNKQVNNREILTKIIHDDKTITSNEEIRYVYRLCYIINVLFVVLYRYTCLC